MKTKRNIALRTEAGVLNISTELSSLSGNRKPYFSVSYPQEHKELCFSMVPGLQLIASLHLADEDGYPLFEVENGLYHLDNGDMETAAKYFRVSQEQACAIQCKVIQAASDSRKEASKEIGDALSRIQNTLDGLAVFIKGLDRTSVVSAAEKLVPKAIELYDVEEEVHALLGYPKLKEFREWIAPPSARLAQTNPSLGVKARKTTKLTNALLCYGNADDLRVFIRCTAMLLDSLCRAVTSGKEVALNKYVDKQVRDAKKNAVELYIASHLRNSWLDDAAKCKEFLEEPDIDLEDMEVHPMEEELIRIDDDVYTPVSTNAGGNIASVSIGDREYYIASSREHAGRCVMEYYRNMAKHDPREVAEIVGEDNLVRWALGQLAGPGSTKVRSFEEWVELVGSVPEEFFAAYDGNEIEIQISHTMAVRMQSRLGRRDWKNIPDQEWIDAVAYRSN